VENPARLIVVESLIWLRDRPDSCCSCSRCQRAILVAMGSCNLKARL